MARKKLSLKSLIENDPLGLLNVKAKVATTSENQRLIDSFEEVNHFIDEKGKAPESNRRNIKEHSLHTRLKNFKNNTEHSEILQPYDRHGLLTPPPKKEIKSLSDIFSSGSPLLQDNAETESLFEFKHVERSTEREEVDFVARRKPCKQFEEYKPLFQSVQKDLGDKKRKLTKFKEEHLKEGHFFVHKGVLLFLAHIDKLEKDKKGHLDGRTRVIYENGTESNVKYRTIRKNLYDDKGKTVTENVDNINANFYANQQAITEDDKAYGYIYVLKSLSTVPTIQSLRNLYKIGYSKNPVKERIRNAENEVTYLMAPVEHVASWKCYNVNPQKLEYLLHTVFRSSGLNVEVKDNFGKAHKPKEWFTVPLPIIKKGIEMLISGDILDWRYDRELEGFVRK